MREAPAIWEGAMKGKDGPEGIVESAALLYGELLEAQIF
jgi:hypothetical protein